jgi:hypothetical protein
MSVTTQRLLFGLILFTSLPVPGVGALVTYSSRDLFNAAAPGLPLETFEAGLVAPGAVTICNGPLTSASASACFPAGGLLPGVTYSAVPGPSMALLGADFPGVGNTSKVLGPNLFPDTLDVTFASANSAGFDFFPGLISGNVAISIFGPANVLLGVFVVNAPLGPSFFGVTSDTGPGSIGRINIASQSASPGELIDNLAFGNTVVPEPYSLLLTACALVAFAGLRRSESATRCRR